MGGQGGSYSGGSNNEPPKKFQDYVNDFFKGTAIVAGFCLAIYGFFYGCDRLVRYDQKQRRIADMEERKDIDRLVLDDGKAVLDDLGARLLDYASRRDECWPVALESVYRDAKRPYPGEHVKIRNKHHQKVFRRYLEECTTASAPPDGIKDGSEYRKELKNLWRYRNRYYVVTRNIYKPDKDLSYLLARPWRSF